MLPDVANHKPHDLDHHQHEQDFGYYLVEIQGGFEDLKDQPGDCPNHESEKRQADGEHQNVLRRLEEMSSQAVNVCVRNRKFPWHVSSRFCWSSPLLRIDDLLVS